MEPVKLGGTRNSLLSTIKSNRGVINTAIEVGTWRGDFAQTICDTLQPNKFYAVDPFALYEGYTDKPDVNEFANQENLDNLAARVAARVSGMNGGRPSELIRKQGKDAAQLFEDNSLDFVYIDADHKYEAVKADIATWFPKLKSGGIMCGHDYIERSHIEEFGVIPAVHEFVAEYGLKFAVTGEGFATWVICKDNKDLFFNVL